MSDTPSPDSGQDRNGLPGADAVEATLRMQNANPEDIDAFRRLLDYGHALNLSQADLARTVKVDGGALSKIFNGKYPTGIGSIADRVREQMTEILRRKLAAERPLVDTWVLREVGLYCQATRASRGIGILTGRSHTGKTTGLKHYTERTPNTVYMRMRAGGAAGMFAKRLARACGFSDRQAYSELVDRAIGALTPEHLLIVDEAHQTVVGRRVQTVTLGLIQEIHDETGCSVVLCATPVFRDRMLDERLHLFFEQIENRGTLPRKLPRLAPMKDIEAIVAAYGLPPAPAAKLHEKDAQTPLEVMLAIREKHGLGKLINLLFEARRIAANRREPFSWNTVLDQDATGQSWDQGDGPDEEEQDGKGGALSMERMDETIWPGAWSPEHVVSEHRVGLGLMHRLDGQGREYGVVLGIFDGPRDEPFLVGVRLLTPEQAEELAAYLIDTAVHARGCNLDATQRREGE